MTFQKNHVTGLLYQGKNQASLLTSKTKNGYQSNEWLTFLQAREKGLKIKKGSHGVHIFKGFESFNEEKDGKMVTVSRPLGFATVFNLDQTESFEDNKPEYGKVYALTGGADVPCIANGNSWKEAEVKS